MDVIRDNRDLIPILLLTMAVIALSANSSGILITLFAGAGTMVGAVVLRRCGIPMTSVPAEDYNRLAESNRQLRQALKELKANPQDKEG